MLKKGNQPIKKKLKIKQRHVGNIYIGDIQQTNIVIGALNRGLKQSTNVCVQVYMEMGSFEDKDLKAN